VSEPDPAQLVKTLTFLLRQRTGAGLDMDDKGWVALEQVRAAVSQLLEEDVPLDALTGVVGSSQSRRFELRQGHIRAVQRRRSRRQLPPDIVYHAATQVQVDRYVSQGRVAIQGRPIYLSSDERQAWRAAHRLGPQPRVLYVDSSRARRHGVWFQRNRRSGLYHTRSVGTVDVLNLLPNYAEQLSAGGIPMVMGNDGVPRLALIRVARRSGITWEVAKGKLEPGEPPEHAAVREVREEMGLDVDLRITCPVGLVRYGFMAPGGLPRLKTVHLYLMEPLSPIESAFRPSTREGIGAVQWFTPDEACNAVTHSSLVPAMRRVRQLVESHWPTGG
jgi:RNA:NAD 2'-phosphotransferase (TPT1/KptA family)/8-oxo-dGTP pyrophosphatase MutT (NUDIX family)